MIRKLPINYKHAVFVVVLVLGIPIAAITAFSLAYQNRAYPGTSVCDGDISGMTREPILAKLAGLTQKQANLITIEIDNQSYKLPLSWLKYQPEVTVDLVFASTRKSVVKDLLIRVFGGKASVNIGFGYQLDEASFDKTVTELATGLTLPASEPSLMIKATGGVKQIEVKPGISGKAVNERKLKADIRTEVSCPKPSYQVSVSLERSEPRVSNDQAAFVATKAALLLGREVTLVFEDMAWVIKDEELIGWLDLSSDTSLTINQERFIAFVDTVGKQVEREPVNAVFEFKDNRVAVFTPETTGIRLNASGLTLVVTEAINKLVDGETSGAVALPVIVTKPKITTGETNSLGITEVVGVGSSYFRDSIPGRIHNIKTATVKIQGALIPPGTEFSFNAVVGDISKVTGYKQAYIIKDGRTILGDGGGVCQVSTTVFRAALNAGLPIVERHAHAYRVHYYEDDLGPGFDATVYSPTADLKFTNDTAGYLLLQTQMDEVKKKLTFTLFGTKDGRVSEVSKARVWDKSPALPDVFQDDPTLPVGTVKQVDWKVGGAKAAFDYKVSRNGEVLTQKTFSSAYRPWPSVFLRGTRI